MLDAKQRRFTLTHPLHVDQYGGVVRIVSTTSPFTLKGIKMPILGYRYQVGTDEVEEHHYTIDGLWDPGLKVTGYDLWDADLSTIKPLVAEHRHAINMFTGEPVLLDTDTDDDYLALAEELAQQEEDEAVEDDTRDYEGDPDAPMGPSRYTGRNI